MLPSGNLPARAARVQLASRAMGWMIQLPSPSLCMARDFVIRQTPKTRADSFFGRLSAAVPSPRLASEANGGKM
jgi:hypothetical protein